MNLGVPLLLLFLTKGSSPSTAPRRPFRGGSANNWFVVDYKVGAAQVPASDVFGSATGRDLVISFVSAPGKPRVLLFRSPSSLALAAISDFGVNDTVVKRPT